VAVARSHRARATRGDSVGTARWSEARPASREGGPATSSTACDPARVTGGAPTYVILRGVRRSPDDGTWASWNAWMKSASLWHRFSRRAGWTNARCAYEKQCSHDFRSHPKFHACFNLREQFRILPQSRTSSRRRGPPQRVPLRRCSSRQLRGGEVPRCHSRTAPRFAPPGIGNR
jgi:hypothetical protein